MKKTELQKRITQFVGTVAIETIWSHDTDEGWNPKPGDWNENEQEDDWQCWQSEIRASCIVGGEIVTGSEYMGGTWEKAGDMPSESNPEISGYEQQMTVEALEELKRKCMNRGGDIFPVACALDAAKNHAA